MYFFLLLFFLHLKRSFQIDQRGGEANSRHRGGGGNEGGGNQEVEGQNIPSGVSGGETERDVRPGRGAGA